MQMMKENEPYIFKPDGEMMAKVLLYYGLIPDASQETYKIVCPFHNDMNPSMIVDISTGSFFCFGCQLSGDAYKFVSLVNEKDNDLQVLNKLFKILKSKKVCSLNVPKKFKPRVQVSQYYDEAHDYFYGLSKVDWKNDDSQEVLECKSYMSNRGFKANSLIHSDARITFNVAYPIIFPMLDNGEFKGWVCRTNKKEIEAKRKYLYNKGFSRATTLVGNYGNKEYLFIVEGYMDRLKFIQHLHSLGIEEDVVAILGWKMTKEQELKIKNFKNIKCIISVLDNDEYGKKGTKYLSTIFPNVIRFSYIKGLKDIGETSKEKFKKMYDKTLQNLK